MIVWRDVRQPSTHTTCDQLNWQNATCTSLGGIYFGTVANHLSRDLLQAGKQLQQASCHRASIILSIQVNYLS